jgi:hypothetical protein
MMAATKLQPDRDLQCYFYKPSAVAALSGASPTGFTVSGSWRQQFDWAVMEWNRDNNFDHPALRNLPDGDLSGVSLSWQETRTGCIPFDSTLYAVVDWPSLRVWADVDGVETIYYVPLKANATAVGGYTQATAVFTLGGSISSGDYIELAWPAPDAASAGAGVNQHYNYEVTGGDTLSSAVASLAAIISANQATGLVSAVASGATITLTYLGMPGANGNRVGVYGTVQGAKTETWTPASQTFSGGASPATWNVSLNFGALQGYASNDESTWIPANLVTIPTANVRKLRWTWAPDLAAGAFVRTDWAVVVTSWSVTGTGLQYSVAGPGSRRIEDDGAVSYAGTWVESRGNYSGGSIHSTTQPGATVTCNYGAGAHTLYLGVRCTDGCAPVTVQVDGGPAFTVQTELAGEDISMRVPIGAMAAGAHTVTVTHAGTSAQAAWFDFLECAVLTTALPAFAATPKTTLATDWDTDAAQFGLAAERTAWLINALGFPGRANHYAGALWWYELALSGNTFASATVTITGATWSSTTTVNIGGTPISHLNLYGDTAATVALALAMLINAGSTGVRASAAGAVLTITSRTLGTAGNGETVTASGTPTPTVSGALAGGVDGTWLTDLAAAPPVNRAARDWHTAYFAALKGYGIAVACSFSMELGNGDPSTGAGIAQRYPDGSACMVNTPALQTNFGPQSTTFWKAAYLKMAALMTAAGVPVYLQFGEVQWWYFCPPTDAAAGNWTPVANGGMPFYDAGTTAAFTAAYGGAMHVFTDPSNSPAAYPHESAFLPGLIGTFCAAVRAFVKATYPTAVFEVLYPPDTNNSALMRVMNLPAGDWTPANLACLKTENFTYTGNRDVDQVRQSVALPATLGFPPAQASHLVGVGDYTTPWTKEWSLAMAAGDESVVLFALDQFCLIGYALPLVAGPRTAGYMGVGGG